MRILEFIHDYDHPESSNIDLWVEENKGMETRKILAYEGFERPDPGSYDLILIHGGIQHIWDKDADPWLYDEIEFIKEAMQTGKPVIGFCLGSQIIAEILGGRVYKAQEKEIGCFNVFYRDEYKDHLLLKGIESGFKTFMWHSDHYELPDGCTSPGFSEAAPYQIFISSSFPAIGFQFHPEYTKEIIKNYFEECYDQYWIEGRYVAPKEGFLEELEQMPDTYLLFRQLMNNAIEFFSKEFNLFRSK